MPDEDKKQSSTKESEAAPRLGKTQKSATSVAMSATFNYSESRKHNFDVSGAASIEATLLSVPPPAAFVEFITNSLKGIDAATGTNSQEE